MNSHIRVKRALLSVSDKTGLVEFAQGLHNLGIEIISTGGTASTLRDAGLNVTDVSSITEHPEILGGRVKTLHPKIHGGILARRPEDNATLEALNIPAIDLVVVNLYPFEKTTANPECTLHDAIESIDIGGPAMIRAAAKNFLSVGVVTDNQDYMPILYQLQTQENTLSTEATKNLAAKAFTLCACYNSAIADYMTQSAAQDTLPETQGFTLEKIHTLRYGENPQQQAAIYHDPAREITGILASTQHQGKALSYNNYQDADAAWAMVSGFNTPACAIVKHANPCGIACRETLTDAYQAAFSADSTSAFGGILAFNRILDASTAQCILKNQFAEVILAPDVSAEALTLLNTKPNIRVLTLPISKAKNTQQWHNIGSGFLCQSSDNIDTDTKSWQVVTHIEPTEQQWLDLRFAWQAVAHVKSNAIVFAKNQSTCAIGAGQMSRIFAIDIAQLKAQQLAHDLSDTALASDAFFPFADGVEHAVQAGARCIIQPGGSMRDQEVIDKANALGIAMVFTGKRHFKH